MLPADFSNWRTCYKYFRQWSERPGPGQDSILEQVLKKSVGAGPDKSNGRKEQTSFCIVDSQSVKNTDTAGHKGYDAGKKVSGIKRHIAVDTPGLPHGITRGLPPTLPTGLGLWRCLTGAETASVKCRRCWWTGGLHREALCHCGARALLGASVEVVKRNELHTFVVLPKRWVVERSFAWLEKCRRLWKNCERKLNTSLQMVVLAFTVLILKKIVKTGS